MNKNDLLKKLESLNLPKIEISSHQRQLRMALLNSSYWKEKTTMSLFKKFMPVSAVAVVAIVAVGVLSMGGGTSQIASAQELAQKSYRAVSMLTPEMQAELANTTSGVNARILEEAKNAKDLEVLTYEQFAASQPIDPSQMFPEASGFGEKMRTLKFLRFTDTDGGRHIIGIDEKSGIPVFGTISIGAMAIPAPSN